MKNETLVIQIQDRRYFEETDELGRNYIGYSPDLSDEQIYEAARGFWSLNPSRVFQIDRIFVVYNDRIVLEANLTGLQRIHNGKYYFTGDIINNSEYVGKNIRLNKSQNRVNYIDTLELEDRIY